MIIRFEVSLDGTSVLLEWEAGTLRGDADLIERVERRAAEQGRDLATPTSTIAAVYSAFGAPVDFAITDQM